jgi:hypothetical protein
MAASCFDTLISELRKGLFAKIMNECICWCFELFSSPNPQNKQCKRHTFLFVLSAIYKFSFLMEIGVRFLHPHNNFQPRDESGTL